MIKNRDGDSIYEIGGIYVTFGHGYKDALGRPGRTEGLNVQITSSTMNGIPPGWERLYTENLIWKKLKAQGIRITGNSNANLIGVIDIIDDSESDKVAGVLDRLEADYPDRYEMLALARADNDRLKKGRQEGHSL